MNDTEPIRPTPDPKHTTELHWDNVIYGSGFICFTVLISVVLGLKLTKPLLISSTRCVVQLTLLGLVLENILNTDNVWLVLGLGLAFVILASFEIVQRKCKYQFFGMLPCVFLSLLFSCLSIGIIANIFALSSEPFWDPYRFIPTLGMLIGNTMVSISLGLNTFTTQFKERRDCIEVQLAFGASRWEVIQPVFIESLRSAMLPTINMMSVMGLITIPGMMTGQILGGEAPMSAVKYQQIIMFMINAASALGTIASVLTVAYICVDSKHRMQVDRITSSKDKKNQGCFTWLKGMFRFRRMLRARQGYTPV